MPRIVYVNGHYLERRQALVASEDRGFQFADGVYEGIELRDHQIVDLERHFDRLYRSMTEIGISHPPLRAVLTHVVRETVRRNRYRDGFIYLQVTRGVAARDFAFPPAGTPLSIVCMVYNTPAGRFRNLAARGIKVVTRPDIRWQRVDIKSLQLLPGVLARQAAKEQGAQEAWLLDAEGYVTEGAASNAWIVTSAGELVTRQTDSSILSGVTRRAVAALLEREGLRLVERAFHIDEAMRAKEAFITASTNTVMPVVAINGVPIGDGEPGSLTLRLRELYQREGARPGSS
jgi:D-alanine transaminase